MRGGCKCDAESIADDLEDMALMGLEGFAQGGVMPLPTCFPLGGMRLGELRAALDVGEEEGDGAGEGRSAIGLLQRQLNRLLQRQRAPRFPRGVERRFVELRAQDGNVTLLLGLVMGIAMTPTHVAN